MNFFGVQLNVFDIVMMFALVMGIAYVVIAQGDDDVR